MRRRGDILFCFLLTITGIILLACHHDNANSSISVEHDGMNIRKGKIEVLNQHYNNLEDLEKKADLIIIGTPLNNLKSLKQSQTKTTNHDPLGEFWADTPFEVSKVVKGNFEDKEITNTQPILIEADKNQILTLSGYSPLLKNAE